MWENENHIWHKYNIILSSSFIPLSFLLLLSHIQWHTHAQDADSTVFGVDLFAFIEATSGAMVACSKSVIVQRMKALFTDSENIFFL